MAVGVGIDVGSRTTRVVRLTERGGRIRSAGSALAPTPPDDDPEAARTLIERIREAGIKTRNVVAGVAGKDMMIRYSKVPPAPAWKLRMIMAYEATQGNELDVAFDYRLLNLPLRIQSHEFTVMTAIARNEVLAERIDRYRQWDIHDVDFAPDALAVYEVFSRCPEASESLDKYCLVLDIGASKTEMVITYNGGLVFARSISFGGNDFTQAIVSTIDVTEEMAERLKAKQGRILSEAEIGARPAAERPMLTALGQAGDEFFGALRASLMFAKAQTKLVDLDIGRIYVSGTGAALKGMKQFLADRLGARASYLSPPDDWEAPGESGRPCEWTVALGLALLSMQDPDERMSLLPPDEAKHRKFIRSEVFGYAACAVFVLAMVLAAVVKIHNWSAAREALKTQNELLEAAREKDAELAVLVEGNRIRKQRMDLLAVALNGGLRLAAFLQHVKDVRQGPVVLTRVEYQPGNVNKPGAGSTVILHGRVGESTQDATTLLKEFQSHLRKAPGFNPPDPKADLVEHVGDPDAAGRRPFRIRVPLASGWRERP
jgi:type IV pilus assembly protein PilM